MYITCLIDWLKYTVCPKKLRTTQSSFNNILFQMTHTISTSVYKFPKKEKKKETAKQSTFYTICKFCVNFRQLLLQCLHRITFLIWLKTKFKILESLYTVQDALLFTNIFFIDVMTELTFPFLIQNLKIRIKTIEKQLSYFFA